MGVPLCSFSFLLFFSFSRTCFCSYKRCSVSAPCQVIQLWYCGHSRNVFCVRSASGPLGASTAVGFSVNSCETTALQCMLQPECHTNILGSKPNRLHLSVSRHVSFQSYAFSLLIGLTQMLVDNRQMMINDDQQQFSNNSFVLRYFSRERHPHQSHSSHLRHWSADLL